MFLKQKTNSAESVQPFFSIELLSSNVIEAIDYTTHFIKPCQVFCPSKILTVKKYIKSSRIYGCFQAIELSQLLTKPYVSDII